jgi:hypothetical protein
MNKKTKNKKNPRDARCNTLLPQFFTRVIWDTDNVRLREGLTKIVYPFPLDKIQIIFLSTYCFVLQ